VPVVDPNPSVTPVQPEEEEEAQTPKNDCPTTKLIQRIDGKLVEGSFCCGHRNEACTWEIAPVCATFFTCTGSTCKSTMRNACQACTDATVNYIFPVPCPGDPRHFEEVVESPNSEDEEEDDYGTEALNNQEAAFWEHAYASYEEENLIFGIGEEFVPEYELNYEMQIDEENLIDYFEGKYELSYFN